MSFSYTHRKNVRIVYVRSYITFALFFFVIKSSFYLCLPLHEQKSFKPFTSIKINSNFPYGLTVMLCCKVCKREIIGIYSTQVEKLQLVRKC